MRRVDIHENIFIIAGCRNDGFGNSGGRVSDDIHVVPVHEKRPIMRTHMKRDL